MSKVSKKKEWNTYLTDADKFKIDEKKMLQKKKLLISRHNILIESGDIQISRKPVDIKADTAKENKLAKKKAKPGRKNDFVNSLDLIMSELSDSEKDFAMQNSSKQIVHNTFVGESKNMQKHHSCMKRSIFSPGSKKCDRLLAHDVDEIDHELLYIVEEIRSLYSELKHYEELSGKRSILDTKEELNEILKDDNLLNPRSAKVVMRYLVELVCQSMSYLLKSAIDLQEERNKNDTLTNRIESLTSLITEKSQLASSDNKYDSNKEYRTFNNAPPPPPSNNEDNYNSSCGHALQAMNELIEYSKGIAVVDDFCGRNVAAESNRMSLASTTTAAGIKSTASINSSGNHVNNSRSLFDRLPPPPPPPLIDDDDEKEVLSTTALVNPSATTTPTTAGVSLCEVGMFTGTSASDWLFGGDCSSVSSLFSSTATAAVMKKNNNTVATTGTRNSSSNSHPHGTTTTAIAAAATPQQRYSTSTTTTTSTTGGMYNSPGISTLQQQQQWQINSINPVTTPATVDIYNNKANVAVVSQREEEHISDNIVVTTKPAATINHHYNDRVRKPSNDAPLLPTPSPTSSATAYSVDTQVGSISPFDTVDSYDAMIQRLTYPGSYNNNSSSSNSHYVATNPCRILNPPLSSPYSSNTNTNNTTNTVDTQSKHPHHNYNIKQVRFSAEQPQQQQKPQEEQVSIMQQPNHFIPSPHRAPVHPFQLQQQQQHLYNNFAPSRIAYSNGSSINNSNDDDDDDDDDVFSPERLAAMMLDHNVHLTQEINQNPHYFKSNHSNGFTATAKRVYDARNGSF